MKDEDVVCTDRQEYLVSLRSANTNESRVCLRRLPSNFTFFSHRLVKIDSRSWKFSIFDFFADFVRTVFSRPVGWESEGEAQTDSGRNYVTSEIFFLLFRKWMEQKRLKRRKSGLLLVDRLHPKLITKVSKQASRFEINGFLIDRQKVSHLPQNFLPAPPQNQIKFSFGTPKEGKPFYEEKPFLTFFCVDFSDTAPKLKLGRWMDVTERTKEKPNEKRRDPKSNWARQHVWSGKECESRGK